MKKLIVLLSLFAALVAAGSANAGVVTLIASDDAYIYGGDPDTNFGSEDTLRMGQMSEGYRFLAKWDLSGLVRESDGGTPVTLTPSVDTAYLRFSMERSLALNQGMGVATLDQAWDEDTVTWNSVTPGGGARTTATPINWGSNLPAGPRWEPVSPSSNPVTAETHPDGGATGIFKYHASGSDAPASPADAVISTYAIAGWLDGSVPNHGVIGKHWGDDMDIRYWSKEGASDFDNSPLLIIEGDVALIPEPAMAGIMLLGGVVTLLRRRRR